MAETDSANRGTGDEKTDRQGMMEGDGGFKSMEAYSAIEDHFKGTEGSTDDPTFSRKTRMQLVRGNEISEESVTLPSADDNDGLTNDKYHNACGGKGIPMTYG